MVEFYYPRSSTITPNNFSHPVGSLEFIIPPKGRNNAYPNDPLQFFQV